MLVVVIIGTHGKHRVFHEAGTDLTIEFEDAPHDEDIFQKFEIVGVYKGY